MDMELWVRVPLYLLILLGAFDRNQTKEDGYRIDERMEVERFANMRTFTGKRVERMCKALDMQVLIAERKGSSDTRDSRTAFEDVLKQCTTLILTCPLDPSTRNMISHHELSLLSPTSILINVGRGGIVNEAALATALKEGKLLGAGMDVFEHEPATKQNCPLLADDVPGLVATPHLAWYSDRTIVGTKETVRDTIEAFVRGEPKNVVVDGRS